MIIERFCTWLLKNRCARKDAYVHAEAETRKTLAHLHELTEARLELNRHASDRPPRSILTELSFDDTYLRRLRALKSREAGS